MEGKLFIGGSVTFGVSVVEGSVVEGSVVVDVGLVVIGSILSSIVGGRLQQIYEILKQGHGIGMCFLFRSILGNNVSSPSVLMNPFSLH